LKSKRYTFLFIISLFFTVTLGIVFIIIEFGLPPISHDKKTLQHEFPSIATYEMDISYPTLAWSNKVVVQIFIKGGKWNGELYWKGDSPVLLVTISCENKSVHEISIDRIKFDENGEASRSIEFNSQKNTISDLRTFNFNLECVLYVDKSASTYITRTLMGDFNVFIVPRDLYIYVAIASALVTVMLKIMERLS